MKRVFPILILSWLAGLAMSGCLSQTPVVPDTAKVTVVETLPVEVTRLVEVPVTVEVTRQVIVNQTVQVPVTVTPTPEATQTQTPSLLVTLTTPMPPSPTPTFPLEKVEGYSVLLVVNETGDDLVVEIYGPVDRGFTFKGSSKILEKVKEGLYTYRVIKQEQIIYQGSFNITNPDKFELHIRSNKVVFLMP